MSYGMNPYAGAINILGGVLSPVLGTSMANSDWMKQIFEDENMRKLLSGALTTGAGAAMGAAGGSDNILPGALSALTPYAMMEGMNYMGLGKNAGEATAPNGKPLGAAGGVSGASKDSGGVMSLAQAKDAINTPISSVTQPQAAPQAAPTGSWALQNNSSLPITQTITPQAPAAPTGSWAANAPGQGLSAPAAPAAASTAGSGAAPTATSAQPAGVDALVQLMRMQMDPRYAAMTQAPAFAGAFTGMGETSAYNKYRQKEDQAAAKRRARNNARTDRSIEQLYNDPGYRGGAGPQYMATGGFINDEPVEGLGPMDRVPSAQPYLAAAPSPRDVINPNTVTFAHGGPLRGNGDGMSDDIPATIDGKHPAKVAAGEFVVPKQIAEKQKAKLEKMMRAVRMAAHPKRGEQIKQDAAKREFIRQMTGVKA